MKLNIVSRVNNTYYYVSNSVREGDKVYTRNIKKLGDLNTFISEGYSNPLAHAQDLYDEYVRTFNQDLFLNVSFNLNEDLELNSDLFSKSTYQNVGCAYLDDIYNSLEINNFFIKKYEEKKNKYKYDLNSIIKLIVFSRILTPGSKLNNYEIKDNFIINTDKVELHQIYRALDLIYEYKDELQYHIFKASKKIINRKYQVMYFDCTNYYFETRDEDEDIINEHNLVEYGLRKYGLSKQHQPKPIVQCGLYVDEEGIPVYLDVQPGNMSEKKMAIPSENKIINSLNLDSLIYCADAGLNTSEIKANNIGYRKGYILTESLKILNEYETSILLNDLNWEINSFDENVDNNTRRLISKKLKRVSKDKFIEVINKAKDNIPLTKDESLYLNIKKIRKSYTAKRLIKITNIYNPETKEVKKEYKTLTYKSEETLNKAIKEAKSYMESLDRNKYNKNNELITYQILEEKLIVTFDKYYYFYSKDILNKQIERAKENVDNNKYLLSTSNSDPKRFVKIETRSKKGEKVDTNLVLDNNKAEKERRYLGFYLISTSLINESEKEIIKINSKRWKIEERFRVTKTYFNSRPVYLSNQQRIKAHFYLCYLALTILSILEKKLNTGNDKYKVEEIIKTLNNMKVQNVDDMFYISLYESSKTLNRLEEIFNLGLTKKKYPLTVINKFKNRKSSSLLNQAKGNK